LLFWTPRVAFKTIFNQWRSGSVRQEAIMADDDSLVLARAVLRVAQHQIAVHINLVNLDMAKIDLWHGSVTSTEFQQAEKSVALAQADLETAVRDLAAQLAAWKAAP
jgi:hypothetical protein